MTTPAFFLVRSASPSPKRLSILHIASVGPTQLRYVRPEGGKAGLCLRIVCGDRHQRFDWPHPVGLLCARLARSRRKILPVVPAQRRSSRSWSAADYAPGSSVVIVHPENARGMHRSELAI